MFCIFCESPTKVTNSRSKSKSPLTWRRRECKSCKSIFSTQERPNLAISVKVRDSSGKYKPFSEEKLFISVYDSLSHRKDALEASKSIIDTLISSIVPFPKDLSTELIAESTYGILKRYDKTSSQLYKARYPIF